MFSSRLLRYVVAFFAASGFATAALSGESIQLRPYKDRLFAYPPVIESRDNGAFLKIDYRKERDIDRRDKIPERRVKGNYVSMKPKRQQRAVTITASDIRVEAYEVGSAKKAKFAVIFIHGRGGDRRLGAKDWTFGGNFNRLKNLSVRNGGVYYAPTIPSFDKNGLDHLKTLVTYIRHSAPGAPVILACGSMGSILCWQGSNDPGISSRLAGIIILGGTIDESFMRSAAYHAGVPVLLAHGSGDRVYDWRNQHALYQRVRYGSGDIYPIRFVLFQSGSHGTPIRMVDWRDTLNWMLARRS
ncbi:alpha/beta hydrolase [Hoeflea sp. TYP-13]|uniref:alpha/beta hydrolase n=1 Tax=Hoeflea sp. TYP-13 TaxID=3230023 RepID=UPI0034C6C87E